MDTVWVLGDQLNRRIGALGEAAPGDVRVLMIESAAKLASKRFHRQRLHVVMAAMRNLAAELRAEGFEVDHRRAPSFAAGLAAHRAEHVPGAVRHRADIVGRRTGLATSRRRAGPLRPVHLPP